ncbi:uncharacterized protein LTR77_003492 [Saxophila tyrrhenica]|uniref:Amino acid transporter n=1 Tax=Saxophila tyrrhenica TaxID=1690608 RepID=A0AAV9PH82_9PEZI|nr:hypothetical protein LTR77_003492 [Saxophila tyrrhenica]
MEKPLSTTNAPTVVELISHGEAVVTDKVGTEADIHDMLRMGKVQQMQRIFNLFPMVSFSIILMASWEIALGASVISIFNGGVAGTLYIYIVCWIGFLAVYSSMAEMGEQQGTDFWRSIPLGIPNCHEMPASNHAKTKQVSEFAPQQYQKILSYFVGWLSTLGWQIAVISTAFQAGVQIQGLLVLNYPDYVFERWHGTLLVIAVVSFGCLFNVFLAKQLPFMEVLFLIFHICGFFCVLIPLLVLGKKSPSKEVWTMFFDGGWDNQGVSTLVGILFGVIPLLGADAAAHMAEELTDASYTLPRAMMYSTLANGGLGLAMMIAYCYVVGDFLKGTLAYSTPTGFGYIQVFFNVTGSHAGASAMCAVVIIVIIFCSTTMMATTSRQLFAFARDRGMPFSSWLAHVNPRFQLPINAIVFSFFFSALLSLINIGSTVAFNIINSVGTVALMLSYMICISCLLWRKLTKQPLLPSKYPPGQGWFGIATNVFALCFLPIVFIFSFFPPYPEPALTLPWMNFAVVIFGNIG